MSDQLTLGVVGHVDHGKTALVRALTGIETDRLKEEKERGLSIVLGFSYLRDNASTVDLIDSPGHESFIRAMISGATGIDGIVLVIAANEGIMPQTKEHFDIARLLGADRGIVVLNKIDLVTPEESAALADELRDFVAGTFLDGAEVVRASATTGAGIAELKEKIFALTHMPVERPESEQFYLPLDRVFTMRGFGIVGTGTLRGGRLQVGDRVEIMPRGGQATVRALQNHNESVQVALPGQRVAVNLRSVKREDIERGNTLAAPGLLTPSRRLDVELQLLEDYKDGLKNAAVVRLLIGTSEAIAKVRLLGQQIVEPGEKAFAQLRCDREIATHNAEQFLIRSYSPMRTIGGGRVLDVAPARHGRFDTAVTERLQTTAGGDSLEIFRQRADESGRTGFDVDRAARELGIGQQELQDAAAELNLVLLGQHRAVAAAAYQSVAAEAIDTLSSFHTENPHAFGLAIGLLRGRLDPEPAEDVLRHAVEGLVADGKLEQDDKGLLRVAGFDPLASLSEHEREVAANLEHMFLDFGVAAPSADSLIGTDRQNRAVFDLLLGNGRLIRLRTVDRKASIVLHSDVVADAKHRIRQRYPHPEKFTIANIRDLFGSTRKYIVPLMEHFDAVGTTVRVGDHRYLKEP